MSRFSVIMVFFLWASGLKGDGFESDETLKVALSAAFVSEQGIGVYGDLVTYLGSKLSVETELIDGLSYKTINGMISDGAIQAGFICGLPYVLLKEKQANIEVLAAPVMKNPRYSGKAVYFSDLIVSADSDIKSISDLKGKVFVYNEKISNSGYNLPRKFFIDQKVIGKGYFKKIIRSGSHEASIKMVATGEADYSFVDSLVLEYDRHKGEKYAMNVKVIHSLGPSAIPPVIVSKEMNKIQRDRFKKILTEMNLDPMGKKILDNALVEKFVPVTYEHYRDILEKWSFAKESNTSEIR